MPDEVVDVVVSAVVVDSVAYGRVEVATALALFAVVEWFVAASWAWIYANLHDAVTERREMLDAE